MLEVMIETFFSEEIYFGDEEFDSCFERELCQLKSNFSLWYSDLEDAGIRKIHIAYEDGQIVGFLTTNINNQGVAIEVLPEFRNQRIALQLLDNAECYYPERDENEGFWRKIHLMREVMREYRLDSLAEVKKYILCWRYKKIKEHTILISVDYRGYVYFSVDSSVSYEKGYIPVTLGGVIFRWLQKAFQELVREAQEKGFKRIYCSPVDDDSAYLRRVRAYQKMGFIFLENGEDDVKMVYHIG